MGRVLVYLKKIFLYDKVVRKSDVSSRYEYPDWATSDRFENLQTHENLVKIYWHFGEIHVTF